ncbi:MAG: glutathione peroxidase [Bacteroidetes bacterium]|nr:glutathione peroxidase [Bacteroidota bacterium]
MKWNKLFASIGSLLATAATAQNIETDKMAKSIYDYEFINIAGDTVSLSTYKGKKILIVNVASECGFTPQYKELQEVHNKYKDSLVVLGFPCNQFGAQEPGTEKEIAKFCEVNFGVTFTLTEKIEVRGNNQHPIYTWLTSKALNGVEDTKVMWNFQKYLIGTNGEYLGSFASTVKPDSDKIIDLIENK